MVGERWCACWLWGWWGGGVGGGWGVGGGGVGCTSWWFGMIGGWGVGSVSNGRGVGCERIRIVIRVRLWSSQFSSLAMIGR